MFNLNGALAESSLGADALENQLNPKILIKLRDWHKKFAYTLPYVKINFIVACVLTGVITCVTVVFIA